MKKFQMSMVVVFILAGGIFFGLRIADSYFSKENLNLARTVVELSKHAATSEKALDALTTPAEEVITGHKAARSAKYRKPQIKAKKNTLGSFYGEGDVFGVIDYNGTESAVVAGTDEESLDHQAMIHRNSTPDHIVMLGHNYADGNVFGALAINHSKGVQVSLTDISGKTITYSVVSSEWVDEETYDTEEYIKGIFNDSSDLVLITCQKSDGVRGRLIVTCEQNQ